MLLDGAGARKVIFFGGKGGVGKTTLAGATAVGLVERGRKVLLVSTDPAHNLGHLWGEEIGDSKVVLSNGLEVLEIDPQKTTDNHIAEIEESMKALMAEHLHGEVRKHLALAKKAPGTHEAAVLERIGKIVLDDHDNYDHIIFDTAPSGHTVRLLELPELMRVWTDGMLERRDRSDKFSRAVRGMSPSGKDSSVAVGDDPVERRNQRIRSMLFKRRELFERLRAVLTDSDECIFYIVLVAERLPIAETIELYKQLGDQGMFVGGLVVNRMSPKDEGDFLATRAKMEEGFLKSLRSSLVDVPIVQLPLLSSDISGLEELSAFARSL